MNGPKDTDLKGRVGRYWEGLEVVVVVGKEGAGRWPGGGSSGDPVCSSGKVTECGQSTVHDCCFPRGPQSCQRTNVHERKM